ncbi:SMI1/KNR4 family protein [Paraburkholderia caribensis]|uniref:SMI1/KNR4 family protein n=1 Tax=Paraburkholderia caribensis TaxID=75105 RepID=UPI001CC78A72|nr:SMI1/KNR4 family protein [Paraburkholderia caribensis]
MSLPCDYKEFLLWSDGGEGHIYDLYLSMWTASQIIELNDFDSVGSRLGTGFVGIRTDSGDYCFALDLRNGLGFVVVPLCTLSDDEVKSLAATFLDGLADIRDRWITGNDL